MPTVLIVSQTYLPDRTPDSHHMAHVAAELVRRGNRVVVYAADRDYDDPSVRYPRREVVDAVEVRRLPFTSFGKGSLLARVASGILLVVQATLGALVMRDLRCIFVCTSPPMAPFALTLVARLRRVRSAVWLFDINPDLLVALGWRSWRSPLVRLLDVGTRLALRWAGAVIALDRFMADWVRRKVGLLDTLVVAPLWAFEDQVGAVPAGTENPFRARLGLRGKRVVMYAGNHGAANPLATLIEAARRLQDESRLTFVFVGGGVRKVEVESAGLPNVIALPYEPVDRLEATLAAADVHVVSLGPQLSGLVHPCKIYNVMRVGRPVLYIGPAPSYMTDLLARGDVGWHVEHDDVDATVRVLRTIADADEAVLRARGDRGRALAAERFGRTEGCARVCDAIEGTPASLARAAAVATLPCG